MAQIVKIVIFTPKCGLYCPKFPICGRHPSPSGYSLVNHSYANYSMLMTLVSISKLFINKPQSFIMKKEPILLAFGRKVHDFRKERNLSQEQLAEVAGLHRTYIGMIERAEKNITLCNIEKISKALKIDIKDFF